MLIVSWNVASWNTTLAQIRQQHGSLGAYLGRLGADILCVQETKLSREKLEKEPNVCFPYVHYVDDST